MLSTVDTNPTIDKKKRSNEHPSECRTVEKPVAVVRDNVSMAGVDHFDQIVQHLPIPTLKIEVVP